MRAARRRLVLLAALALLAACAQTQPKRAAGITADAGLARGAVVLVVEPDVRLTEILANGVEELRADWTLDASKHVSTALNAALAQRQASTRPFQVAADFALADRQRQILRLQEAVGVNILMFQYLGIPLAHKRGALDWTLGAGARVLDPDAGYALFIVLRDSYSSTGSKAMLALAPFGIGVPMGEQIGFASLVDLNNGRVVWFNLLQSATGDLRNAADARIAISHLLDGAPL